VHKLNTFDFVHSIWPGIEFYCQVTSIFAQNSEQAEGLRAAKRKDERGASVETSGLSWLHSSDLSFLLYMYFDGWCPGCGQDL
jgi:hypothetical protein